MERLQHLFQLYLDNKISSSEYEELWHLLNREEHKDALGPALEQLWNEQPLYRLPDEHWQQRWNDLKTGRVVRKTAYLRSRRWMAAAAIAALVLAGGAYLFKTQWLKNRHVADTEAVAGKKSVIEAGKSGAIVYLESGRQIILDTAHDGTLAKGIAKEADVLTLDAASEGMVTIATPRGRQQQVVLPDGTRLWLNAASEASFHAGFPGTERELALKGEAYFEVTHNALKPFIVKAGAATVKVTGTQFNIMAYLEEPSVQTTLVEGHVEVSAGKQHASLLPGMQSLVSGDDQMKIVPHADVESAIAWKEGWQVFRKAGLQEILRKIERWYDVDVVYETDVPDTESFTAVGLSRRVNLADLLKVLENDHIKFETDDTGRKVYVKRK